MTSQSIDPIPTHLGRYRVTSCIGAGNSGIVYRAWDDDLLRDVAIRVPNREWLTNTSLVDQYLADAGRLSRIDHAGIVPLFDVGRTDDGRCYLVTKFISGGNLGDRVRRMQPSIVWVVDLIIKLADALHFAHRSGLVHGNVKPWHILFDEQDLPCLTDFGLPLVLAKQHSANSVAAGAAYQSPEQLCGEQHRIDARADVYSLGAVLYELVSGEWPLCQRSLDDVIRQAVQYEPPLLSDVDPTLPAEMARICQRALAPRIADRYTTVVDFATDLQLCLALLLRVAPSVPGTNVGISRREDCSGVVSQTAAGTTTAMVVQHAGGEEPETRVVPKGLRSFDQDDSDFFLELLPGPRGRDGLPEVLRFWKSQIEETDPDQTFSVGLIYGPSGCGKSSMVKAGLLPRLGTSIISIYLEATPGGTEARLLSQLRRRCSQLPNHLGLIESLSELRRAKCLPAGTKVVVFLDQFEQWLHASRDDESPELAAALRQCDGRRLQCVLMVRDDFWMAVTRFMHDLEVKLVEGHNSAAVDLFGQTHARKVLTAFGRAFECLPRADKDQTSNERGFLDQAVEGLSNDGKVISVQLALFAEMVKNKPWVPSTFDETGGAEGIGLAFLEETFSGPHAPPEHRRHQRAARAVLRLLLPEQGTNIKGQMHSREQLIAGSGYTDRPQEFCELLQILDQELRLVTPADPAGFEDVATAGQGSDASSPASQEIAGSTTPSQNSYYQLTHDFLVPSVRRWLVRKQQETRRGRAELLLEDKAATWSVRPERRYLPTAWQWFNIRTLTRPRVWNTPQRAMMRSAALYHSLRAISGIVLLTLLCFAGFEAVLVVRAQKLRDRLLYVNHSEIPGVIREMASNRPWVNYFLRNVAATAVPHSPEDIRTRLAMLPEDSTLVDGLFEECFTVDDPTLTVIAEELSPHREQLIERLWKTVEDPVAGGKQQLCAGIMLARYAAPKKSEPASRWSSSVATIARRFHEATLTDPGKFQSLVVGLAPIKDLLIDHFGELVSDATQTESDRAVTANILVEFAAGRPEVLTRVLLDTPNPTRQSDIIDKLLPTADRAVALLEPELAKRLEDLKTTWKEEPFKNSAAADPEVVRVIEEANGMLAERFAFITTLPIEQYSKLADELHTAGYRPTRFRPYLAGEIVLVSALWTRDGRNGGVEMGLSESEMRKQVNGPRMKSELLLDLAAYQTTAGEVKHVSTWVERRENDPEATIYIGPYGDIWNKYLVSQNQAGFGIISQDFQPLVEIGPTLSAVFWKARNHGDWNVRTGPRLESELSGELAAQVITTIDVTPVAIGSRADARRSEHLKDISYNEEQNSTSPEKMPPWMWIGDKRFIIGRDEQAIRDFTYMIDHWSPASGERWMYDRCHEYRSYAAARLGRKEDAAAYLNEANAAIGDGEFWREYRRQMVSLYLGELNDQVEEFEKFAAPFFGKGWAEFGAARVYSVAAGVFRATTPARAVEYTDRAIQLLELAINNGEKRSVWWFVDDPHMGPILDDPRMIPMQIEAELDNILAVKYARAGNAEKSRAELIRLMQGNTDWEVALRAQTLVDVVLGDDERAMRRVEESIAGQRAMDADVSHYAHVGCYALASYLLKENHPDRSKIYADRALELLEMRINRPWGTETATFRREILWWWGFTPLLDHPKFSRVVAGLDRAYSVAFVNDPELESKVLFGLSPEDHLNESRKLIAFGFRPVAVDGCIPGGASLPGIASVWHRPKTSERQRNDFAHRQSSAAIALFRLGKVAPLWSLLKADGDLQLRTWLVQSLGPSGADPLVLAKRLAIDPDVSVRRSLLLAMGKSAIGKLMPADREGLVEQLLKAYRSDPDAGIHSAAEWTLKKWNQKEKLVTEDARLSLQTNASRRWTAKENGDTLVTVPGPIEFYMGTPNTEAERDAIETRHRRRIPRSFEIATKEVTIAQWGQFLKANPTTNYRPNRDTSPEPDCPAGMVTANHAAAYCRWLSEQQGIREDEIGYPPADQIREECC